MVPCYFSKVKPILEFMFIMNIVTSSISSSFILNRRKIAIIIALLIFAQQIQSCDRYLTISSFYTQSVDFLVYPLFRTALSRRAALRAALSTLNSGCRVP
ncbi:hypothetical protein M6B38_267405 [Iris pallida]|uniref:Secreted protein n=1 Tax=Iris pallida TaxID=29817 RepID=A0AAX6G7L4_IRIPA|nr:hypothetical protein M6B38_102520 [Iris pallida]KAJ6849521.1 hypothetical protein M6B38_267405 [Iris pallida]